MEVGDVFLVNISDANLWRLQRLWNYTLREAIELYWSSLWYWL